MTLKFPLSGKLKTIGNWNTITYKKINKNINKELYINKILKILFLKTALISSPRFYYTSNKVYINIFVYKKKGLVYKIKSSNQYIYKYKKRIKLFNSFFNLNQKYILKLNKILTDIMGIPVILKIKNINNPYLNSEILTKFLALKFRKSSYFYFRKKMNRKIKTAKYINNIPFLYNYNEIMKKNFFNKIFVSYISGIKWIFTGRLTKRKTASRARKFIYSIGNFHFNSNYSMVDSKSNFTTTLKRGKGKKRIGNGTINVKVFINNTINYI